MTPFLLHRLVLCSVSRLKESKGKGIKSRNKIREEQFMAKKSSKMSAGWKGKKSLALS